MKQFWTQFRHACEPCIAHWAVVGVIWPWHMTSSMMQRAAVVALQIAAAGAMHRVGVWLD